MFVFIFLVYTLTVNCNYKNNKPQNYKKKLKTEQAKTSTIDNNNLSGTSSINQNSGITYREDSKSSEVNNNNVDNKININKSAIHPSDEFLRKHFNGKSEPNITDNTGITDVNQENTNSRIKKPNIKTNKGAKSNNPINPIKPINSINNTNNINNLTNLNNGALEEIHIKNAEINYKKAIAACEELCCDFKVLHEINVPEENMSIRSFFLMNEKNNIKKFIQFEKKTKEVLKNYIDVSFEKNSQNNIYLDNYINELIQYANIVLQNPDLENQHIDKKNDLIIKCKKISDIYTNFISTLESLISQSKLKNNEYEKECYNKLFFHFLEKKFKPINKKDFINLLTNMKLNDFEKNDKIISTLNDINSSTKRLISWSNIDNQFKKIFYFEIPTLLKFKF